MNFGGRSLAGVGVAAVVAALVGGGCWFYNRNGASSDLKIDSPLVTPVTPPPSPTPTPPSEFGAGGNVPASPTAPASPTPAPTPIMVHVAGRVKNPGLYEMRPGDRIKKAIDAAGGFLPDADTDTLNLADYVRDADKYYVGKKPETPAAIAAIAPTTVTHSERAPAAVAAKAPAPGRVLGSKAPAHAMAANAKAAGESRPAKFKNPGDGVINLNTADLAELQRLPGVGPATAEKIIEKRKEIGAFADVSQLTDVKGIGAKRLAKMQPFLTVR